MRKIKKIGLFDSGIGGLTTLRSLQRNYPNFDYIYFADRKNLPYGDKEPNQILDFSRRIVKFLISRDVDLIVIPCNTSSAIAVDTLRQEFNIPIIDIISPIVSSIANDFQHIAVIGTQGTINSCIYKKKLQTYNKDIEVLEIACPKLVPLIEADDMNRDRVIEILKDYLQPILEIKNIESLIYGCTHYRYLSEEIVEILGKKIIYLEPSDFVVQKISQLLTPSTSSSNVFSRSYYYVTGNSSEFLDLTKRIGLTLNKDDVFEIHDH